MLIEKKAAATEAAAAYPTCSADYLSSFSCTSMSVSS